MTIDDYLAALDIKLQEIAGLVVTSISTLAALDEISRMLKV